MESSFYSYRLRHADQNFVYEWLKKNQVKDQYDEDREELELELLERSEPLINLGLALFSKRGETHLKLMETDDINIKKAVLSTVEFNRKLGVRELKSIVESLIENFDEELLKAYFSNPRLEDSDLVELYNRKDIFDTLDDEQWHKLLFATVLNERLSREYDSSLMDGESMYDHTSVFRAAWKLFDKLPVNFENADLLEVMTRKLVPDAPSDMDVMVMIEKWGGGKDLYGGCRKNLSRLFKINSDEFKALKDSTDLFLREAYYSRVSPNTAEEIRQYYEKDGQEFIDSALHNDELYANSQVRDEFLKCCWDCERDRMQPLSALQFESHNKRMEKKHPEWYETEKLDFDEVDDVDDEGEILKQEIQLLHQKVDQLQNKNARTLTFLLIVLIMVIINLFSS